MNSDRREKTIKITCCLFRLFSFSFHSFIQYLRVAVWSLGFVSALAFGADEPADGIRLSASETLSTAGYFQLRWSNQAVASDSVSTAPVDVILQQSKTSSFDTTTQWHITGDQQFSISGLASGHYFYRVGRQAERILWSNIVEVEVAHHSLSRAFALFALGAVLFLALIVVIFFNRHSHNESGY